MTKSFDSFLRSVRLRREAVPDFGCYPFSIPVIRALDEMQLNPGVTFFLGENGTGKSTLLEAIAVALGFNAEGGTQNFRFATRSSESDLWKLLRIAKGTRRPRTGFFFRAESFFNVATEIERLDEEASFGPPLIDSYGGKSLHEQSHGESFFSLVLERFGPEGLYLLDEPESALSPARQVAFLRRVHDLLLQGSQFIIATHSPILLSFPDAWLYELSTAGIRRVPWEETEHVKVTRSVLLRRETFFRTLFEDAE